jgi:hypothetical protein
VRAKPDDFPTRLNVASDRLTVGTGRYRLGSIAGDGVMRAKLNNRPNASRRSERGGLGRLARLVGDYATGRPRATQNTAVALKASKATM